MNSSSGLGRPSADQPDFDGPAGAPGQRFRGAPDQGPQPGPGQPSWNPPGQPSWNPPGQPGPGPGSTAHGAPPASGQPGWPPPTQTAWTPPNQPVWTPPGQPPQQPQRSRRSRGLIVAGAVGVVTVLALLAWQLFGGRTVTTVPSTTPTVPASQPASPATTPRPTVVRTTASAQPTTSTPVTGGGIGQSVPFETRTGTGRVQVTKATWADNGLIEPQDGTAYLIVDVTFEGVSGTVTTGPFFTSVTDERDERHVMTIGAPLDRQLGMRTLSAGEQNTGQVGFELARGPVTFAVLSELLETVATVDLPA